MMRLTKGNPQRAATVLITLTLALVAAAVGVNLSSGLPFNVSLSWPPSHDYTLSAAFQDAGGVYRGANVVIAGADVGQVTGVSIERDRALVTMRIGRPYGPLHAGTVAAIRYSTLLAQKYIELTPAAGTAPLPDGAVIPSDQTVTPVDFDQFLSSLDAPTRAQLQVLLQELGGGVDGEEAVINALVDNLAGLSEQSPPTLDTFRLRDPQLASIIGNLVTVAGRLAQSHQQLGQLIQNFALVNHTLVRNDARLDDLLLHLANVSQDSSQTLRGNQGNLRQTIAGLDPFLVQLNPQLTTAAGYVGQGNPTLQAEATYLIPEVVSAIAQQDAGGHYLRQFVVINTCYDLVSSRPANGSNCLVQAITGLARPRSGRTQSGSAAGSKKRKKKPASCPTPSPSPSLPLPTPTLPIPVPTVTLPIPLPTPTATNCPAKKRARRPHPTPSPSSLLAPLLSVLEN
jgi:phospholipid/cholesterol/gamma-HCH transport system substrate-binding protein